MLSKFASIIPLSVAVLRGSILGLKVTAYLCLGKYHQKVSGCGAALSVRLRWGSLPQCQPWEPSWSASRMRWICRHCRKV